MHPPAALGRRYLSLFYEALLLAAFIWAAAFVYSAIEQTLQLVHVRLFFQAYLAGAVGIYFVTQWVRGGQTLAMKAWRLRLERRDGKAVMPAQAMARYALALAGTVALGITFIWPLAAIAVRFTLSILPMKSRSARIAMDMERPFLHDRIAGTRIVHV